MEAPEAVKDLVFDKKFVWFLGAFFGSWASTELVTSYGIAKFLNVSDEQAHILTSGMEFGRKATLLRNVVYRSDHPKKQEIVKILGKLQNDSKRNVLAHGYIISDPNEVTFIDRSRGGDYVATEHTFTLKQFCEHVISYMEAAKELEMLLEVDKFKLSQFARAALSARVKQTKS